jgi:hypothetical protein
VGFEVIRDPAFHLLLALLALLTFAAIHALLSEPVLESVELPVLL